jgi:predicted dehydrogenase
MKPLRVGLIGCGFISDIYLENAKRFDGIEVAACADLDMSKAEGKARQHAIPKVLSVHALLEDAGIDAVLNLTTPDAHAPIALQSIAAGKHVYNEKPLTLKLDEARRLLDAASAKGLRVGCAPDTFLGAGIQTCRKVIDDGLIGEPVAASAFMLNHGHEHWHPNVDFYYQPGGGPVFDMGPYYLTALHFLLGPVSRVTAMTKRSFEERVITEAARYGTRVKVNVPTHVTASLAYVSGPLLSLTMSFDVWAHELPWIEIYGTEGTLSLPDPNYFEGPVRIKRAEDAAWREVPLAFPNAFNARGIGLLDMAHAIQDGRPHRADGETALHAIEIMHAIDEAAERGTHQDVSSRPERARRFPIGLSDGEIEA